MRGLLLAALLPIALLPAVAAAVAPVAATAPGSRQALAELWARNTPLATLVQDPAQSEREFLLEAAALVDAFTRQLTAEVCGVFERDADGPTLIIVLMTQGSPAFCLHRRGQPVGDGGLQGLSIHSHVDPRAGLDLRCAALRLDEPPGARAPGPGRRVHFLGARFSAADIAAGPGFLVHRRGLWRQDGPGTQHFVARLTPGPAEAQAALALASSQGLRAVACA